MRRVGFLSHPSFLKHDTGPSHPERPQRLSAIHDHLRLIGFWDKLFHIKPRASGRNVLSLVHSASYIDEIERACRRGFSFLDPDTAVSPGSWDAALCAAGSLTDAIDQIVGGALDSAFCALRPPGHHALRDRAMGFCLFNNVAIGARYAKARHKIERVLIVDWDVHHGNGTQAIFYDDPSVLYFSTHQYPFYPGTGAREEKGAGAGIGFTINVPLAAGSADEDVIRAFKDELLPFADQFRPQLVLISAGFDAHRDDPLSGLLMSEAGYCELTHIVCTIAESSCQGRIVSVLEGGYNLSALSSSVAAHLRVLLE